VVDPSSHNHSSRFVDTHCHLDFKAFDKDREKVLENSIAAGVIQWMNPGVDLQSSRRVIDLSVRTNSLYAAVGIHPTEAVNSSLEELKEISTLINNPRVKAIGEIGIDHYHKNTPDDVQQQFFLAQLEIAAKFGLPVIIHSRQAMREVLGYLYHWWEVLNQASSPLARRPGVLHSFEGNIEEAHQAIEMGFFLGVSGPITYTNASDRRMLFQNIPLENIVLETDGPYLTPHPYRGQRNEPAYIPIIAQTLADINGTSIERVADITSSNASRLFAWSMPD
jgi:TatD DNase family protein